MSIRTFVTWSIAALWLASATESRAVEPCCGVVEIGASGVVTARETATGRTFQFRVNDRRLLATLKVGQPVYADFTKLQVSVQPDGIEPCCGIVSAGPAPTTTPAGRPTVDPAQPCCAVVEIGPSGLVTARETATGRTFAFQVNDRRLLATLKTGQPVHADFTTMRVSVQPDGATPCCAIVSAGPATTGGPTSVAPCCAVVANAALRRLGRVVVAYPEEVSARIEVFRPGETQAVAGGYGDAAFDLFPGPYDVTISGRRVADVTVQAGHDTQIKVGVLRVTASGNTRVDLIDADKKSFTGDYGSTLFGLPIGEVGVQIAGQTETVAIEAGQVTEF